MEAFKFPHENETETGKPVEDKVEFEVEGDAEPEIEVVDDTPPEDRNRKPLEKPVAEPTDDELEQYSEKVKSRIKELTHARHDERRAKEALARQHEEALRVAQAVLDENKKLKERLTQGETTFVSQAQRLADVEVEKAKAALKSAHEAGDTEAFVEAQAKLNEAVFMQQRVKGLKPTPLQKQEEPANVPTQQAAQPPAPQLDPKLTAWKERNSWFGQDDEMTGYAMGLHNKLVKAGYDPQSQEYYDAIDTRIRKVFPEQFESAEKPSAPAKKPATVVAPASRATSAKKIKLTQSAVAIAKRMGVPLEEYARHAAQLEQQNA